MIDQSRQAGATNFWCYVGALTCSGTGRLNAACSGLSRCGGRSENSVNAVRTRRRGTRWMSMLLIGVCYVSFSTSTSQAQFKNGNRLYEDCTGDVRTMGPGILFDESREQICLRAGITVKQVVDVVTNWLAAHPEDRDMPASSLVRFALRKAFPCK